MDEVQRGLRKLEDDMNYWKNKYLDEKRRSDQYRLRAGTAETMERDLIAMRAEYNQMKSVVEVLREQSRRLSIENSQLRNEVNNFQRMVNDLRAENQNLMQRGTGSNAVAVPSPARSTISSSSCSTLTSCNCPNCAPGLYTPSTPGSSSDSGMSGYLNDRVICPICCYHFHNEL